MRTTLSEENQCYFKQKDIMQAPSVLLVNPKYPHNVGQVFRVAADFLIPEIWTSGERILTAVDELGRVPREERLKGYKDVDLVWDENPLSKLPTDCIPVAVDLLPGAENLYDFEHEEKMVYIFGPEDGTLDRKYTTRCHRRVMIDTAHCLNLANAVCLVLYDRGFKEHHKWKLHS
jgi:tRNA G18 (ribose-2'-O)-methylase SpoU